MKRFPTNLLLIFCLFAPCLLSAQIDSRLLTPLTQLDIKYKPNGNTIYFKQPIGNRTQVIYIDSSTDIFDKFEVRQVYSIIHETTKDIDSYRMKELLLANSKKKIGAFEMMQKDGSNFIIFTAKVSPTLDATDLKSVIDMVATAADAMEEKIFMTDEW